MTEARGHGVSILMFVYAGLAGNKSTGSIQTEVLIFINKASIYWYINRQGTVEASTFGAYFCELKASVYMVEAQYSELVMCGVRFLC